MIKFSKIGLSNSPEDCLNLRGCFGRFGRESDLINILAWAAHRKIPFDDAIATLIPERNTKKALFPNFFAKTNCVIWGSGTWRQQISLVIADLKSGHPLSVTLRKRLSSFLSPYCLAAIDKAEKGNCLAEILPHLAANYRFMADTREHFKAALIYPAVQFSVSLVLIFGLYIIIVPKFAVIFNSLLGGIPLPPLFSFISRISSWTSSVFLYPIIALLLMVIGAPMIVIGNTNIRNDAILFFLIMLQLAFVVLIPFFYLKILVNIMLRLIFRPFANYISFILMKMPFIGGLVKKMALLEIAGAMGTLTAAGYDIAQAARWNAETVSSSWMKKRLAKFANSVEKGEYWADAWEEMKLGSPSQNWIVRNAASRENPKEGFTMLTEWLNVEIRGSLSVLSRFFETFCIVFNTAFFGIVIFALWQALWTLIHYSTEFT